MRRLVTISVLAFMPMFCFAQVKTKDTLKPVTTIGVFDNAEAKSGFLINGYYVEMTGDEFKKYKGKKVKVSGKLSIIKGLTAEEMKTEQGSSEDRKFITEYKIIILK